MRPTQKPVFSCGFPFCSRPWFVRLHGRELLDREMRRAQRALLPAVDVAEVFAGEEVRAIRLEQDRVLVLARLVAPVRGGAVRIFDLAPRDGDTLLQVFSILRVQD